jgi:hypothetical protein
MSVSIADMERVALGGESLRMDEGAVIELGEAIEKALAQ